jgi:hypothetical protein
MLYFSSLFHLEGNVVKVSRVWESGTEQLDQTVTTLTWIREVPELNLGRDTYCSDMFT